GRLRRPVVDGEPQAATGRDGRRAHRGAGLDGSAAPAAQAGAAQVGTGEVMTSQEVRLHGHRITFRTAGTGPVILLIHGITGSASTWDDVMPWLAERYTVVAPDL